MRIEAMRCLRRHLARKYYRLLSEGSRSTGILPEPAAGGLSCIEGKRRLIVPEGAGIEARCGRAHSGSRGALGGRRQDREVDGALHQHMHSGFGVTTTLGYA